MQILTLMNISQSLCVCIKQIFIRQIWIQEKKLFFQWKKIALAQKEQKKKEVPLTFIKQYDSNNNCFAILFVF